MLDIFAPMISPPLAFDVYADGAMLLDAPC